MKSKYFSDAVKMAAEFNTLVTANSTRAERLKEVRRFTNGLAILSEEQAKELGVREVTNYLTSYAHLSRRASNLLSTYTGTNRFCEVRVRTGNSEYDHTASEVITWAINEGVMYHRGYVRRFLKSLAGEIQIAGGAPIVPVPDDGGWLPSISVNTLVPGRTKTDTLELPYFFRPKEITVEYLESIQGGKTAEKANIETVLNYLKTIPESGKKSSQSFTTKAQEQVGSAVNDNPREVGVNAFWYCEVAKGTKGEKHVNGWLVTEEVPESPGKEKLSPMVIAKVEKYYNTLEEALMLVDMDREVGGDTTWDSVRGMAEIIYPSAAKMEELLNAIIEGDTDRAKLRFQTTSESVVDEVLSWDRQNDTLVPKGVEPFDIKNTSGVLQAPLAMLGQNVASLSGGPQANQNEKVVQAKQRVNINSRVELGDVSDWYEHLDQLLEIVVYRILNSTIKPTCMGYQEVMWVREQLENKGVDFKGLSERRHGRMRYITVRVHRVIGEGDWASQEEVSRFLLDVSPSLPPQNRPRVMKMAITAVTRDPDLADELVQVPKAIINAQRITAENECDTIMRRAVLGQVFPIASDDIHQDHIPIHMLDMLATVARHQAQPWTKLDVIRFAALQRHTQDHLEALLGDPKTQDEGRSYIPEFTKIVQAAASIAQIVEDANPEGAGMTPKEEADIQIKLMAEQRKAMELGVKVEESQALQRQRLQREAASARQNFVSEIAMASKLDLEKQRNAREERLSRQPEKKKAE